jgi:murein DD-endopeptidase MepM/ murein hydrolase activator NlpD
MSDINGLIRGQGEPSPSAISPLLGTQRVQSAVDRMAKSVDKVSGWLDKASDRLARMSVPQSGMGSGTTLNGGRANGGGSAIGGIPMLGAGASNGASAHSGTFMGMPYRQNLPTMTQTYGSGQTLGAGKKNGGGASWTKWGAATGAVWGAATVKAGMDRTQGFISSNTSAQLMTRNLPGGDWQRLRTGIVHNNWTAESDVDAFAGASILQRSGLGYGSSAWNTQMSQGKNYRMVDPTATSAEAFSRLTAPQTVGTSNFLLGRGVNVRGKDGRSTANEIIARAGFSGNYKYTGDQINAQWGARGNATMLVAQLAKVDPEMARLVEDQLRGSMQAQAGGMSRDAYTRAVNTGDWSALAKAGIRKTDLDNVKDKAARQRNIDDNMAGGFSTGLNAATSALGLFQEALEKVTGSLGIGAAIGMGHGITASSGMLSSAAHIGASAVGWGLGGKLAGSLFKNGIRGTARAGAGAATSRLASLGGGSAAVGAGALAAGAVVLQGGKAAADTILSDDERNARKKQLQGQGQGDVWSTINSWSETFNNNFLFGLPDAIGANHSSMSGTGGSSHEQYGVFGTGGEGGGNAVMPVGNAPITAGYGHYPKSGKPHHGIDFGVPTGTPVHANRSGKVIMAGWSNTGFGNHVRIDIGDGTIEIYGHLSQIGVRVGQTVRAGDVIGKSGATGNASGPHLHFEVRKGGGGTNNAVDPRSYLKGADSSGYTGSATSNASPTTDSSGSAGNALASARSMTAAPWGVNEGELVSGGLGALTASLRASSGEGDSGQKDAPQSGSTAASGSMKAILQRAGFSGNALNMAYAIMMAESGGNARAHNTNTRTGDNSYGLFQINMLGGMGPERRAQFHLGSNDALFDPLTNAKVAYAMSHGGQDWSPWSTYKRGEYKKYLGGQTKSYDVGSTNIDVDQVARVHKGEMILDPVTADQMRKALSSNTPTSVLGGKGKVEIKIGNITITTAHQFVDSAATDLAKQFIGMVANHDEIQKIMEG